MKKTLSFAALALAAAAPAPASAGTILEGVDALKEWNLIVFNDLDSNSEVEGRTFVGGDLTGPASNYNIHTPAPTVYDKPALTVVGDVIGSGKKNVYGDSDVGGDVVVGIEFQLSTGEINAGGSISNTNQDPPNKTANPNLGPTFTAELEDQRNALISSLSDLSDTFKGLTATDMAVISGNKITFSATPDMNGLASFDISSADLASIGEIEFALNGADTVIVNVSGAGVMMNDNFLGNSSELGRNVIWNFFDATTIGFQNAFYGSVLAPNAQATNANFIEGSVVFDSFVQSGEIHLDTYDGDFTPPGAVPEPSTWMMMLLGFGALGLSMRRRKSTEQRLRAA